MKILQTLFISASIIFSLVSFKPVVEENDSFSRDFSFTRNGSEEPLIHIKFNEDNTFEYQDKSNPSKIINTSGKYSLKGHNVKLYNYKSDYSIPNKWTLDKNNHCIKTRKVLKFTRICNCD